MVSLTGFWNLRLAGLISTSVPGTAPAGRVPADGLLIEIVEADPLPDASWLRHVHSAAPIGAHWFEDLPDPADSASSWPCFVA